MKESRLYELLGPYVPDDDMRTRMINEISIAIEHTRNHWQHDKHGTAEHLRYTVIAALAQLARDQDFFGDSDDSDDEEGD